MAFINKNTKNNDGFLGRNGKAVSTASWVPWTSTWTRRGKPGGESPAGKARRGKPGGDSCPENVRKRMSNRCASHILSVNLLQFVGKRRFENINMVENENVG